MTSITKTERTKAHKARNNTMDLGDLLIFRTVVEAGGITRAAEKLHRVQSNITTRIRQLEEKLEADLFVRKGKTLTLSPAGQALLPYADRLLALADEARRSVRDGTPRGPFVLGAMESTAAVRLPAPLSRLMRDYPDLKLSLQTGNPQQLAAKVLEGKVDAALITGPIPGGPFERSVVFSEELVVVAAAGHAPLAKKGSRRDQLPPAIVAFETGCPHRARLEQLYAQHGSAPLQTLEISSYHVMLGCVAVGMGISLVPRSVLATFPERKRLSVHELPKGLNSYDIELIWRAGAVAPKTIAALAKVLQTS
jgi:DNA-binding transcriptional LysR family regulator